jgi:NAD(P)-dependent dehydrogenase (short-subunit alcohol dehydrogenase family)
MTTRAALVTGASSGIGLAIARMLAEEGHGVTMVARRPDKLASAAAGLAGQGLDVAEFAADVRAEEAITAAVAAHKDRYGRLDVLVNNAGIGVAQPPGELTAKMLDLQLSVNLRALPLFYRECLPLLRAAAAEHHAALVVNLSSIAAQRPEGWLAVYSAAKAGVVAYTAAMNRVLAGDGIRSCAICPAFVDTAMTDWAKGDVPASEMIRPQDVAELVRALLRLSPNCVVPVIPMLRPGDSY